MSETSYHCFPFTQLGQWGEDEGKIWQFKEKSNSEFGKQQQICFEAL